MAAPRPVSGSGDSPELPSPLRGRRLVRSIAQVLLLAAGVVLIVVAVPGLASIRSRLSHGAPGWLVLAAGLRLASAISYVVIFRAIFCPRLSKRLSYRIAMSGIGLNALVPAGGAGGLALGGWVLHRGGMSTERIAQRTAELFLFTSAFNVGAVAVIGWIAVLGITPIPVSMPVVLVPTVVATAVIAAALVAAPRLAALHEARDRCRPRSPERWITRALITVGTGARGATARFRERDLPALAGGTGYLLFDIAVLWATVRAFHAHPPVAALAMAYLVGQLAGEIPIPGGIGVVDGGLIGAMVLYGFPTTLATASSLAYHAIALAVPILFGGGAAVSLVRTVRSWSRAPAHMPIQRAAQGGETATRTRGPSAAGAGRAQQLEPSAGELSGACLRPQDHDPTDQAGVSGRGMQPRQTRARS